MSLRLCGLYSDLTILLKKNKFIDASSRILGYPLFAYWLHQEAKEEQRRRNGYEDPRFMWIKDYRNKYAGKRCFVVGAGPSLTTEDLDALKGEVSFAVNGVILALDKTEWRPTFYGLNDRYAYEVFSGYFDKYPELEILMASFITKYFKVPERCKLYPARIFDQKMYHRNEQDVGKVVFYDNLYHAVYNGYSIVFPMLQFAVYMGFKEIYLLGCDCNYRQKRQHFIEFSHRDKIHGFVGDRMIYIHEKFKEFADARGVNVVNCTRGGMLEAYPRMTLEDVLAQNIRENTLTAADNNAISRTAEQPNSRTFHDLVFIFFADNRKFIPSSRVCSQNRGRNFSCSHRLEVAA